MSTFDYKEEKKGLHFIFDPASQCVGPYNAVYVSLNKSQLKPTSLCRGDLNVKATT